MRSVSLAAAHGPLDHRMVHAAWHALQFYAVAQGGNGIGQGYRQGRCIGHWPGGAAWQSTSNEAAKAQSALKENISLLEKTQKASKASAENIVAEAKARGDRAGILEAEARAAEINAQAATALASEHQKLAAAMAEELKQKQAMVANAPGAAETRDKEIKDLQARSRPHARWLWKKASLAHAAELEAQAELVDLSFHFDAIAARDKGRLHPHAMTRKGGGRPIELSAGDDVWITRGELRKLMAWAAVPLQRFTLWINGHSYTVVFDNGADEEGRSIQVSPVLDLSDIQDGDYYCGITLRFLTVA